MTGRSFRSVAETIAQVAEEIARASPECADKAMRIVALARSADALPDRETIQGAIESQMLDSELSDSQIRTVTSAVLLELESLTPLPKGT